MLTPTCKCGQEMHFPKRKNNSMCTTKDCGMRWERRPEGFWAVGLFTLSFTPILTSEKACSVRSRKDRYSNYPKSKRRKGRRIP